MDSPHPRGGVPLHEAAELLGVTVELLRKRAQRKTIPAYKVDGRWYVVLEGLQDVQDMRLPGPVQDRTGGPGQDVQDHPPPPASTVSPAARSQLEAIRDEWLRPLVDRIGELEREAGRLQAERDALAAQVADDRRMADQLVNVLQAERDALQAEVERLRVRSEPVEPAASQGPLLREPSAPIGPPAWRTAATAGARRVPWWRRLFGLDR
ncbi:MAG: hypothetical protein M3R02_10520 [Chloroflexota bacterium]|nr:hypothetical protein [Chloroflexota bacterium]